MNDLLLGVRELDRMASALPSMMTKTKEEKKKINIMIVYHTS